MDSTYIFPIMTRYASIILIILLSGSISLAQKSDDDKFEKFKKEFKDDFERYRLEKKTEFEKFRQQLNEEYAQMIGGKWENFKSEKAKPKPTSPKPSKPLTAPDKSPAAPRNLPVSKIVPPERKIPDVPVSIPKIDRSKKQSYPINFTFYGTPCGIRNFDTSSLSLSGTDNASLKKAWGRLTADGNLDPLVDDCIRLREEMQLCDWGFLKLADKVSQTLYPKSPDSQAFLTDALLTQAGYDCRLTMRSGKLGMAFHPSHQLYSGSYLTLDGKDYYIYGQISGLSGGISTYRGDFRKSPTPIRMAMDRYPLLAAGKEEILYSSSGWKKAPPFDVPVNKYVMQFLDEYPVVDWNLYGLAPMSPESKSILIPVMEILTEGMGELEAVNLILSYLNHGFKYMTDGDQFNREKPFFPDENFFYPYNDCEDRAILFAKIVKEVLGLDAVYLKMPNHLAAAVRFSPGTKVSGASVNVDGRPYYVCDPTCIGAPAGYLAPKFANSFITVHKIEL